MSAPTRILQVAGAVDLTADIREVVLVDAAGAQLRSYTPGSHLVIDAGGKHNAYSLTGAGIAPTDYRISVLRRGDGGGSDWLHDTLRVGDHVKVTGPTSAFAPVLAATRSILVAAGVGVTPVLSHLRAARAWGRPVQVVYGYRPGSGAHLAELRELAGPDLVETHGRDELRAAVTEVMGGAPWGTHAYACGPHGVLEMFADVGRALGWPAVRLHVEYFTAPELEPGRSFTAFLRRSDVTVRVPSGVSLLDALLETGTDVANLCRQGVCGQCVVPVARGRVEHRDLVLSQAERQTDTSMLACVSRAADDDLEIDL